MKAWQINMRTIVQFNTLSELCMEQKKKNKFYLLTFSLVVWIHCYFIFIFFICVYMHARMHMFRMQMDLAEYNFPNHFCNQIKIQKLRFNSTFVHIEILFCLYIFCLLCAHSNLFWFFFYFNSIWMLFAIFLNTLWCARRPRFCTTKFNKTWSFKWLEKSISIDSKY
jgi:hypothetical protein